MKKTVFLQIICLLMIFMISFYNKSYAIGDDNTIDVNYNYNQETNQVTATIKSNVQLKDTKPTWKLSEDKFTYTKIFSSNMKYTTPVEDINGNVTIVPIEIVQIESAKIIVDYSHDEITNQVTAKIISNTELKDTKPTWKLSDNRKEYTKIFSNNMKYTTPVEDINGNIIDVEINVTDVKPAKIDVKYEYIDKTNQVIATIISNMPLKDTKPTWKLSADNLTYTKIFDANMDYTTPVEDINGNIINVDVKINQIDITPPEISLEYKFNDDDTITIYIKSNEKLGNTKPTWKLSEDQLVYEKIYSSDENYSTSIQDIHGITTSVDIDFKIRKHIYNQEDKSTVKVRYLYIGRKEARVEIISSIQMKPTKPTWILSDDGFKYTKTFNENNIYTTPIVDINDKTKNVSIIVNLFDNYLRGIDVSAHQGKINWAEVKNSGIDFAIIRCGYGQDFTSQDDQYFARNIAECERLGIPYGVYLYSYALNTDNALSEANHVLRLIKGHNPEYGIWIDLEDDSYKIENGMPSNETFVDIAEIFCEKIKKSGYDKVGIYANLEWWNKKINSPRLDIYDKWVAQWGESCSYDKPYKMWQYSAKGSVNGIEGNVDMDILYK